MNERASPAVEPGSFPVGAWVKIRFNLSDDDYPPRAFEQATVRSVWHFGWHYPVVQVIRYGKYGFKVREQRGATAWISYADTGPGRHYSVSLYNIREGWSYPTAMLASRRCFLHEDCIEHEKIGRACFARENPK